MYIAYFFKEPSIASLELYIALYLIHDCPKFTGGNRKKSDDRTTEKADVC